ncbi:MAG: F0F1 ATP synthase subunit A [Patescibacteria group bacterium]|nr:F0F1 ATP synthase subunit A [Patescibacteria group bacterium]MDD5294303.1 F0F1 ATP synthase subunit A [Patescibacteria group bacterium]MDD5554126.1 F0F1 ATP synthase subunit A [Patescibacteria group bacterium]
MGLEIKLAPDILFYLGGFPVTNTFFWSLVLSLFLIGLTFFIRKNLKLVPGRLQNIAELLLESGYSFVKSIAGTEKKTRRIFPLVFTMFLFILVANLATYIPGQSAITLARQEGPVSVFRAVMSDYSMVFVMTVITFLITQIVAIMVHGPFGYLGKFINFKNPLQFFLGLMDLIGELAKVISLSFRLFGNIFAGEVLGAVMLFLAPFFIPLPFMFLGLLTAVVQAFVFAVLTLVFITMASEIEENEITESASI